jgi:crossover junction endodeoxyribonuclease RusA
MNQRITAEEYRSITGMRAPKCLTDSATISRLTLDYPPSNNNYYRNVRGRTLISAKGRAYAAKVAADCRKAGVAHTVTGPVSISVVAHAPDRRRRDLCNLTKALHDALTKARVWTDDSQIQHMDYRWGAIDPDSPRVEVEIRPMPEGASK